MREDLSVVPSILLIPKRSKKRLLDKSRDLKQLKERLQKNLFYNVQGCNSSLARAEKKESSKYLLTILPKE